MVPTVNKVKGREILRSLLYLRFLTLSLPRVTFMLPLFYAEQLEHALRAYPLSQSITSRI